VNRLQRIQELNVSTGGIKVLLNKEAAVWTSFTPQLVHSS